MPLHLIRSTVEPESEYCYELKTDVWFFGDHGGYAGLIEELQRARIVGERSHVAAVPPDSRGMRCVIVPASKYQADRAVLRVLERIVLWHGIPTMQLVLCGNEGGFAKLEEVLDTAMSSTGGPLDHWHIDDEHDDWMVKRSVSLNLRGAVQSWAMEGLDYYGDELRTGCAGPGTSLPQE